MTAAASDLDADTTPALVSDLIRFARGRGLQPADAQDAAQETVTRYLAQPQPPQGTDHIRAWCHRVTGRLLTDRHRRQQATDRLTAQTGPLTQDAPDTAETHAYAESLGLAATALSALDPRQQQVIRLVDLEDVSTSEAAALMGVTEANLRQIRHRAHKALRKEYLQIGGTAAGLALLFPLLRSAGRLQRAAMSLGPLVLAAAVVVPVTAHYIATPGQRAPESDHSQVLPAGMGGPNRFGADSEQPMGMTSWSQYTLRADSSHRTADRGVPSTLDRLIPSCDNHQGTVGVCTGDNPHSSDATLIGVRLPTAVCRPDGFCYTQLGVTQNYQDLTPLCGPIAARVPTLVCQHG